MKIVSWHSRYNHTSAIDEFLLVHGKGVQYAGNSYGGPGGCPKVFAISLSSTHFLSLSREYSRE